MNSLAPEVVRVRMFCCGDASTLRHNASDLDYYVSKGVRTIILNTEDATLDYAGFERQIRYTDIGGGSILDWARRQRYVNVIIELGNEPDQTDRWRNDPSGARATALEAIRLYNQNLRAGNQNVRVIISLPTFPNRTYFDQFTRNPGDGLGRIGDAFDGVGIHNYAAGDTCLFYPGQDNRAAITFAEQRTNGLVYVTEAGINVKAADLVYATHNLPDSYERKWAELGRRYAQGLSWLDDGYGRVRGVTVFQTDYTNGRFGGGDNEVEHYNVDTRPVNQSLPLHGHWALGNRVLDGQCPVK